MSKIDWKKPLQALNSAGGPQPGKVYTFKSGSQRVVWISDRVYPVDEQGRCTAYVEYPGRWPRKVGDPVVENVPEEPKDHLYLFKPSYVDDWRVYTLGPQTKEDAEKLAAKYRSDGHKAMVVKVHV